MPRYSFQTTASLRVHSTCRAKLPLMPIPSESELEWLVPFVLPNPRISIDQSLNEAWQRIPPESDVKALWQYPSRRRLHHSPELVVHACSRNQLERSRHADPSDPNLKTEPRLDETNRVRGIHLARTFPSTHRRPI